MSISTDLEKLTFTQKEIAGVAQLGRSLPQLQHGVLHLLHDLRTHLRQLARDCQVGDPNSANAAAVQKLVAGL
jgi:hypothetical protein